MNEALRDRGSFRTHFNHSLAYRFAWVYLGCRWKALPPVAVPRREFPSYPARFRMRSHLRSTEAPNNSSSNNAHLWVESGRVVDFATALLHFPLPLCSFKVSSYSRFNFLENRAECRVRTGRVGSCLLFNVSSRVSHCHACASEIASTHTSLLFFHGCCLYHIGFKLCLSRSKALTINVRSPIPIRSSCICTSSSYSERSIARAAAGFLDPVMFSSPMFLEPSR